MADDGVGIVLVLLQEVVGAGESYLVDVLLNLLGCHADAVVAHGDGLGILVDADAHLQLAHLTLEVAFAGEGLQLLGGINGVAYDFANEDFVVAIEKLFDDGEDILGCNPDVTLFHNIYEL